jgi:hypothetical protein
MNAAKPKGKPRGKPFPRGKSGNPAGRPKGIKDKFLQATEAVIARAGNVTPLDFMLTVVRADPEKLAALGIPPADVTTFARASMAQAAAPYCHRRMPIMIEADIETNAADQPRAIDERVRAAMGTEELDRALALLEAAQAAQFEADEIFRAVAARIGVRNPWVAQPQTFDVTPSGGAIEDAR